MSTITGFWPVRIQSLALVTQAQHVQVPRSSLFSFRTVVKQIREAPYNSSNTLVVGLTFHAQTHLGVVITLTEPIAS